jgi:hypothetical protein
MMNNMKTGKNLKQTLACLCLIALVANACVNDDYYMKDLESNERSISRLEINEGQVGPAIVTREGDNGGTIIINIGKGTDVSKIKPSIIEIPYKATISPALTDDVNFNNADSSVNYTVTAESGQQRVWKVKLQQYRSPLEQATWNVDELRFLFAVKPSESWGWSRTEPLPNYIADAGKEVDNTIVFESEVSNVAFVKGTYTFSAGTDGEFSDFVLDEQTNPAPPANDYSDIFRKIPTGDGTWYHDLNTNQLIFNKGEESEAVFILAFLNEDRSAFSITNTNTLFDEAAQITNGDPIWKVWELTSVKSFYYTFSK